VCRFSGDDPLAFMKAFVLVSHLSRLSPKGRERSQLTAVCVFRSPPLSDGHRLGIRRHPPVLYVTASKNASAARQATHIQPKREKHSIEIEPIYPAAESASGGSRAPQPCDLFITLISALEGCCHQRAPEIGLVSSAYATCLSCGMSRLYTQHTRCDFI
jgi:hypothetical protein